MKVLLLVFELCNRKKEGKKPETLTSKGPVTLLRMRETYEKRMKINEIIFIRTKIL
jgi:hypothetical protein